VGIPAVGIIFSPPDTALFKQNRFLVVE